MNSDEMTTGGIVASSAVRAQHASQSMAFNLKNKVFVELFGSDASAIDGIFRENAAKIAEKSAKMVKAVSSTPAAAAVKAGSQVITTSQPQPEPPHPSVAKAASASPGDGAVGEQGGLGSETISKSQKKRLKLKAKKQSALAAGASDGSEEDTEGDRDDDGSDSSFGGVLQSLASAKLEEEA
jgi:hypothetical protein